MAGCVRSLAVVGLLTLFPAVAQAWWYPRPVRTVGYFHAPAVMVTPVFRSYSCSYSAPVLPIYTYYAEPVQVAPPFCVPLSAPVHALPVPAPASGVPLPVAPGVSEWRPNPTASTTHDANKPVADLCTISFWNHADRDLTLRIAGQTRVLPRGRGLTLDLPRQFVWQVGGRAPQTERVPAGEAQREIALR